MQLHIRQQNTNTKERFLNKSFTDKLKKLKINEGQKSTAKEQSK